MGGLFAFFRFRARQSAIVDFLFLLRLCCYGFACDWGVYSFHTDANQFPSQAFIDRVALYTDRIYVTTLCLDYDNDLFQSMNGNITVVTNENGVQVNCSSGDSRVLREWEWFKDHRTWPLS